MKKQLKQPKQLELFPSTIKEKKDYRKFFLYIVFGWIVVSIIFHFFLASYQF